METFLHRYSPVLYSDVHRYTPMQTPAQRQHRHSLTVDQPQIKERAREGEPTNKLTFKGRQLYHQQQQPIRKVTFSGTVFHSSAANSKSINKTELSGRPPLPSPLFAAAADRQSLLLQCPLFFSHCLSVCLSALPSIKALFKSTAHCDNLHLQSLLLPLPSCCCDVMNNLSTVPYTIKRERERESSFTVSGPVYQ